MLLSLLLLISSRSAVAGDICQTKYTILHYAESACVDVERPVNDTSKDKFNIRSVIIAKKLSDVDQQETIVTVPGGPGESGETLLLAMEEREILNSMWYSMNVNIIIYDPRGTGMSLMPKDITEYDRSSLGVDILVDDLKAVIEKTAKNKPVVLLAHSAGGHIALRFAEKYPALLKKLVLVSTSTSPRQMAELTLGLQAKESMHWNQFLKTIKDEKLKQELNKKYLRVEEVIAQQQKARILDQYIHPNLKKYSTATFRGTLISMLEADPTGASFIAFINNFYKIFDEMDAEGPLLVPNELRKLKLTPQSLTPFTYHAKEWMIRLFVCGEGLTEKEVQSPLLLDGLTMDYYCDGLYHSTDTFIEPVLENIQTPVLFFSGLKDWRVPTSLAKETVRRLPHGRIVINADAGHVFFNDKPAIFYDELKAFLAE
jgi:pimeloyl-ACP methyl ester carboxylesterase